MARRDEFRRLRALQKTLEFWRLIGGGIVAFFCIASPVSTLEAMSPSLLRSCVPYSLLVVCLLLRGPVPWSGPNAWPWPRPPNSPWLRRLFNKRTCSRRRAGAGGRFLRCCGPCGWSRRRTRPGPRPCPDLRCTGATCCGRGVPAGPILPRKTPCGGARNGRRRPYASTRRDSGQNT